jgi:hypothetical protein
VRHYSTTDQPEQTQQQLEKQLIPLYWLRAPKILSRESGMHRWTWDLRHPPPVSAEHESPIAAVPHETPRYPLGPLALPGKYMVRLTANGHAYEAPLTVKMDPRVKVSPADLQKKLEIEMQLASAVTRSSEAVMQARSIHEQLGKIAEAAKGPLKDSVKSLDEKASAVLNGPKDSSGSPSSSSESEPALGASNGTLIALYKEVEKADAAPTVAAVEAFTKTESELASPLNRWEQLKTTDIPALNLKLRAAGLPELRMDLPPQQEAGGENEE